MWRCGTTSEILATFRMFSKQRIYSQSKSTILKETGLLWKCLPTKTLILETKHSVSVHRLNKE
jgi:hypothetical protein